MTHLYRIVSIATSLLFIFLFTQLFFMPDSFVRDLGLESSVATRILCQRTAMFMLGIAVLMFASRNLPPSKARWFICLSMGTTMLGLACVGVLEFFKGTLSDSIWIAVSIETLLWISFGILLLKDREVLTAR